MAGESPLLSPGRPPDSHISAAAAASTRPSQGIQLLPFASKPGEGNALIVPPPGRTQDSDESKKGPPVSPQTTPVKSPGKRGAGKDSPKSPAPPIMVCRTVQNLPMDHASMCRMAFEEAPPLPTVNKRSRGRPRTTSGSASSCHSLREEDEDEEESEQKLRLREQLGVSSLLQLASASATDLSVLADVALKMDPDAGDSEETETSDEAEEQKMEEDLFSPESLALVMNPEGVIVLTEHNYCKPPVLTAPPSTKRTSTKQDSSVLLPADLNTISGVLEAPEEVIGEALPPRGDTGEYLSAMGMPFDSEDVGQAAAVPPSSKKKSMVGKGLEHEKEESKKRRKKRQRKPWCSSYKKTGAPGQETEEAEARGMWEFVFFWFFPINVSACFNLVCRDQGYLVSETYSCLPATTVGCRLAMLALPAQRRSFSIEFACPPPVGTGFLCILRLPPTVLHIELRWLETQRSKLTVDVNVSTNGWLSMYAGHVMVCPGQVYNPHIPSTLKRTR